MSPRPAEPRDATLPVSAPAGAGSVVVWVRRRFGRGHREDVRGCQVPDGAGTALGAGTSGCGTVGGSRGRPVGGPYVRRRGIGRDVRPPVIGRDVLCWVTGCHRGRGETQAPLGRRVSDRDRPRDVQVRGVLSGVQGGGARGWGRPPGRASGPAWACPGRPPAAGKLGPPAAGKLGPPVAKLGPPVAKLGPAAGKPGSAAGKPGARRGRRRRAAGRGSRARA